MDVFALMNTSLPVNMELDVVPLPEIANIVTDELDLNEALVVALNE
jgi:hypothetical protein